MRRLYSVATACAASILLAGAAQAATISDFFTRTSAGESLTASFTLPTGLATVGNYTGSIEILVSGTGFSLGPTINDAFYFNNGTQSADYYKLGIGTSAEPLAPFTPTRNASRLISFIDGVGFVPAGTVPTHDPVNHTYNFVIDIGALVSPLSFGVLNGNFSDNGGAFDVTVYQLQRGAIPEPGTWALMIVGFAGVGFAMRRSRTTTPAAAVA